MKILSIDTSSEACSASLNIDGELTTTFEVAPQKHANLILKMCDDLMAKTGLKLTQLDAVAFGQGPGSFTGLRIAAGVIQGIAFGADIPVIKISTLAALAQQIKPTNESNVIIAAIDARMQEIYWAAYVKSSDGTVVSLTNESIDSPGNVNFEKIHSLGKSVYAIGSGWHVYNEILLEKINQHNLKEILPNQLPSAKEIGILAARKFMTGEVVSAAEAIPVYLRNNVAKKSFKQ